MDRRAFLTAVGAASVGGLAGCAALGGGTDFDVGMRAVVFDPVTYRVDVGESVVWHNTSSRGHTVTAYEDGIPEDAAYFASGGFETEKAAREAFWDWRGGDGAEDDSGLLTSGESYSHAFETPGEYHYFCIPHEKGGMTGKIIVEE